MPSTPHAEADLAYRTWLLACESSAVIWLRSCLIMAGGPSAASESKLMVDEKIAAGLSLLPALLRGGLSVCPTVYGARALTHFLVPVRANRRRLSKKK